jgi:hypothetical protein
VVEEITTLEGVRIASVRTDLGPVVIARLASGGAPGEAVALDVADGVPVAGRATRETPLHRP